MNRVFQVLQRKKALWFTEKNGLSSKIGRITTRGVVTEYPLPNPGADPVGISPGPDGALWFTESFGGKIGVSPRIGRITRSGVLTEYPLPTTGSFPTGTCKGPGQTLWFTEFSGNKIGKIDAG